MDCSACGAKAPEDANFCIRCGNALRRGSAATAGARAGVATAAAAADDDDTWPPDTQVAVLRDAAPPEAVPDLVACPSCDAPNSPQRDRCGRCGRRLDGTPEPEREADDRPSGPPAPVVPAPDDQDATTQDDLPAVSRRRRRSFVWIVAVGVVVGAVIGVLAALGAGPFEAAPPTPEVPRFDPARYPGAAAELDLASIRSTTVHAPTGDRRFGVTLLLDGKLDTAWNNAGGVNPNGMGETIDVTFPTAVWLSEIVVANGDQADDAAFLGNARVRRASVALDGHQDFDLTLLDVRGRQAASLGTPRLTTQVRIVVQEVHDGDTYPDLALSELGFRGWVATGQDITAAASLRQLAPAR